MAPLAVTGNPATSGPPWTDPTVAAVRQVNDHLPDARSMTTGQENVPCELISGFDVAGHNDGGCFTMTAFGFMSAASGQINQLGSNKLERLEGRLGNETFAPVPMGAGVVSFTPAAVAGSYMHFYPAVYGYTEDSTNIVTGLTTAKLTLPPQTLLRDSVGRAIPVNPQTLTYSDRDGWFVIEAPYHAFLRVNRATYDILPFTPSFTSQPLDMNLHDSRIAISPDGRYVALVSSEFQTFRVYDLSVCSGPVSLSDPLKPQACAFHDYWPYLSSKITGLKRVLKVDFMDDGLLSFTVTAGSGQGGTFLLAPTEKIDSLLDYLAVGDSYTSGEGAYDYLDGTDTTKDMCHLSARSYPLLLAHDVFSAIGAHSVACSGAVIHDITPAGPDSYRGQVANGQRRDAMDQNQVDTILNAFTPGYLAQSEFVSRYQPRTLTVSVGGDDIGFGHILRSCVEPHPEIKTGDNTCYNTYEERRELLDLIDRTVPRLTTLYSTLQRQAPGSTIFVIGYPQIADPDGNCAVNVHLNKQELEFSADLIDYLNTAVQKAAGSAGVHYVDVSQALVGHRLCETTSASVAMNGLTAGTDAGLLGVKVLGKESYHPNALGQELIEQAILQKTHNFQEMVPVPDLDTATITTALLAGAPHSGSGIKSLMPDDSATDASAEKDGALSIHADRRGDGLLPNTAYTVQLRSNNQLLGNLTTDSEGDLNGQINLPSDAETGENEVQIVGPGSDDTTIAVISPVYIVNGTDDADGDGLPDAGDTCLTVPDSGQDADGDQVDDACDPLIGQTATSPPDGNDVSGSGDVSFTPADDSGALGDEASILQGSAGPVQAMGTGEAPEARLNIAKSRKPALAKESLVVTAAKPPKLIGSTNHRKINVVLPLAASGGLVPSVLEGIRPLLWLVSITIGLATTVWWWRARRQRTKAVALA